MRRYRRSVAASIVTFSLMGSIASAQQRQPDPRGLFNTHLMQPVVVMESYTVRQDLKLTDGQADKLKLILDGVADAEKKLGTGRGGDFRLQTAEQRQERRAEFQKRLIEANEQAVAILTDDQKIRINQIRIWILRGKALFTVEVCGELKITDEQKESILEVFKDLRQKKLEIPMPADGTEEEKRSKMMAQAAALSKEFDEKYLAVLTKDQRARFDAMRGPKIDVDMAEIPLISGRRP
jgi:hypothetical protein